ncbi:MAG: sigma-70 family RNA polymerase sigma factor [Planctomycetota bacterium]
MANPQIDTLVAEHRETVLRVALGILGDRDAATDVTHEAFLALRRQAGLGDPERALAWTLRVAKHRALDRLRRDRRDRVRHGGDVVERRAAPGSDPVAHAVRAEERERLWRGMEHLSHRQREVVVLRAIDGLRFTAIARRLCISEGAAKVHFRRGMAALAALVDPEPESPNQL